MANVKLLFYGTKETNTDETSIECFHNITNQVTIKIDFEDNELVVSLDKETAIRLSKELRKQIALIL